MKCNNCTKEMTKKHNIGSINSPHYICERCYKKMDKSINNLIDDIFKSLEEEYNETHKS